MITIGVTRFNTITWKENEMWRIKKGHKGCVYGSLIPIKERIQPMSKICVLEMHNDYNKIMGIGLIKNEVKGRFKIYSEKSYNNYGYKSNKRISVDELDEKDKKIIKILEILLFTGYRHSKRGRGISEIPNWILNNKQINFMKFIKKIFKIV